MRFSRSNCVDFLKKKDSDQIAEVGEQMRDEMTDLQNQIIKQQDVVIKTANELIASYEELTELMQEKIERSSKEGSREEF